MTRPALGGYALKSAVLLCSAGLLTLGCTQNQISRSPSASERSIEEVNATNAGGAYAPRTISVGAGTTLTWVNNSGNIHNVTFDDPSQKSSGIMYKGDRFSATFDRPGSYTYHCTFHPGMDGVVRVT